MLGIIEINEKIIGVNHLACDKCGSCVSACPGNAIVLNSNELVYSRRNCIFDLRCVQACPVGALQEINNERTI